MTLSTRDGQSRSGSSPSRVATIRRKVAPITPYSITFIVVNRGDVLGIDKI
jgi:hypothetical protein